MWTIRWIACSAFLGLAGCAGPQVVATACPEYQPMPAEAKAWVRRSLETEDSPTFRIWLADLAVLVERLKICREG